MFNIGGGELLVIALIALIVLGPQRLPDVARQVGKTMGDLRRMSTGFRNEMKSALDTADDPTRVAARRNVLAKEAAAEGSDEPAGSDGSAARAAIESVSRAPSASPEAGSPGEQTAESHSGGVAPAVSEPDARRTEP